MSELSDAFEAIWDGVLACYDSELLTWSGAQYACISGELIDGLLHEITGTIDDTTVTVGVKRSLFAGLEPEPGQSATFQGKARTIGTIHRSGDNTILFINLLPANRP